MFQEHDLRGGDSAEVDAERGRPDSVIRWLGLGVAVVFAFAGVLYILGEATLTRGVLVVGGIGAALLIVQTVLVLRELMRKK